MKVSIITVVLNAEDTIENTIKSVVDQNYVDIEYIILDGNSEDSTLQVINRYKNQIDVLISEDDNGLYDAMNKAIDISSGDVIYFLNADDVLFDTNVIKDVVTQFNVSGVDLVYGNAVLRGNDKRVRYGALGKAKLCLSTICHQTIFHKKELFATVGKYDTNYRVVADFDWIMRAYTRHKLTTSYMDRDVCLIGTDGLSYNTDWDEEKNAVLKKYYTSPEILLYRTVPRICNAFLKKIIGR